MGRNQRGGWVTLKLLTCVPRSLFLLVFFNLSAPSDNKSACTVLSRVLQLVAYYALSDEEKLCLYFVNVSVFAVSFQMCSFVREGWIRGSDSHAARGPVQAWAQSPGTRADRRLRLCTLQTFQTGWGRIISMDTHKHTHYPRPGKRVPAVYITGFKRWLG